MPSPVLSTGARVLTITPRAWQAIDDLTQEQDASAVRLGRSDCGSLCLDVTAGPEPDDEVVWSRGTVVYVAPQAAPAADRATLDLRTDDRTKAFYLR